MATVTMVEMGETGLQRVLGARLQACGLGACVGLCLYEASAHVAVLVHVVLPQTLAVSAGRPPMMQMPGKCADTAMLNALAELTRNGGQINQVQAVLVGGAQIFTPSSTSRAETASLSRLEIGQRNVLALRAELSRAGIPICAEETGGHGGRTVTVEVGTGHVWVRPAGLPERLLVTLGKRPALGVVPARPGLIGAEQLAQKGVSPYGN